MISGLYGAISGLSAQLTRVDVAANNIANALTPAYKSRSVQLQSDGANNNVLGVSVVGTQTNTSQGPLMRTDIPTDLAITGNGYFQVQNQDGNNLYTRVGSFTKDKDGYLRAGGGEYLIGSSGKIQIPADSANFSIGKDGAVTSVDSQGNETNVGAIQLATFANEQGLVSLGNGLYSPSLASGSPTVSTPNSASIQSGALEMSNVDYISEIVTMDISKQAFTANTKTVQTFNEMMKTLLDVFKP